jgi:hypothetical protein
MATTGDLEVMVLQAVGLKDVEALGVSLPAKAAQAGPHQAWPQHTCT